MTSSSSSSPEISAATSADAADRFSYKHATHDEVLEDLSSRFILNLPDEELASLERICFQVEQAHWFYEDFIREENPKFPSLPLKKFSAMLFHACPLLHQWSHDHEQAFNTFMQYKTRVPVCGAIMLNDTWEKCILVKGWKSSSGWGFPKGKINEDEPEPSCAVREVFEETGYNLAGQIDPEDVIEMSIKEQKISLYIVPGVPEDYLFKTKTRKEISKIEWFKLTDLPTWKKNKAAPGKFYLISPFIGALKAFINERKPRANARKVAKVKKPVSNQSHILRKEHQVSYTSYHDAIQESSSQSSSADNGDPQTPSPHYTESVANHIAHVVEDDSKSRLNGGSIDPHFARLLSSLTMSASASTTHDATEKRVFESSPIQADDMSSKNSSIAEPVSSSSFTSQSFSGPREQSDWSSSAPRRLSDRPNESPHPSKPAGLPSSADPSARTGKTQRTMQPPPPLSVAAPLSNETQAHRPSQSPSLVVPPEQTLGTLSVSPTSPNRNRRTSSTADISPYLARATEIPSSAKRMRQLALLESVADESARMTPILAHRDAQLAGSNTQYGYPLPPASVPPPQSFIPHNPRDLRVLYSSGVRERQTELGAPHPFSNFQSPVLHATPAYHDYSQVRSRTSHSHRGPPQPGPGSASMNQSQLLALMNEPRATPFPPPNVYAPPPHPSGYRYPSYYPPAPVSLPPYTGLQHGPSQRVGLVPAFSPPPLNNNQYANASSNPLLSILNGPRSITHPVGPAFAPPLNGL